MFLNQPPSSSDLSVSHTSIITYTRTFTHPLLPGTTALDEPELKSFLETMVLSHSSLESSLITILAERLAGGGLSAHTWCNIFAEVLLRPASCGRHSVVSNNASMQQISTTLTRDSSNPKKGQMHTRDQAHEHLDTALRARTAEAEAHAFDWPPLEGSKSLPSLLRLDLAACVERDPACLSAAHALLYFKGFLSLQAHRVAHVLWHRRRRWAQDADLSIALSFNIYFSLCSLGSYSFVLSNPTLFNFFKHQK